MVYVDKNLEFDLLLQKTKAKQKKTMGKIDSSIILKYVSIKTTYGVPIISL